MKDSPLPSSVPSWVIFLRAYLQRLYTFLRARRDSNAE